MHVILIPIAKMLNFAKHLENEGSIRQRSRARLAGCNGGESEAQQITHDFEPGNDRIGLEQSLTFDWLEGERLCKCIDET